MQQPFNWKITRTLVMGVLNVTPDSFSDGGQYLPADRAVARGRELLQAGADLIDVGGESSRPGAVPVSVDEELQRVLPVLQQLAAMAALRPMIAVDTTKAVVAEQALAAGASIINDISALRFDPRLVEVVASAGAGLVLMHMQGSPATMQRNPRYDDVVREVYDFLAERIAWAEAQGVKKVQIAVDPGIGFGKSKEHNLQLLASLEQLRGLGCPILIGASRKSFISKVLGRELADRLAGSLGVAAWAVANGASILRVHDVAETVDVVRLIEALQHS